MLINTANEGFNQLVTICGYAFIALFVGSIIGSIIDRSNLKGGKMRPFILFSAFPLAILPVVLFIYMVTVITSLRVVISIQLWT